MDEQQTEARLAATIESYMKTMFKEIHERINKLEQKINEETAMCINCKQKIKESKYNTHKCKQRENKC